MAYKLMAAAPVLSSGWVLLGDLRKFVPCSPQRFVAPSVVGELDGAPRDADLVGGTASGLEFTVLGAASELVLVWLVTPGLSEASPSSAPPALRGRILVVEVRVGSSGRAAVACGVDQGCTVAPGRE